MDPKILELATQVTIKAMGSEASATNWINNPEKVSEFFQLTAHTINALYTGKPSK